MDLDTLLHYLKYRAVSTTIWVLGISAFCFFEHDIFTSAFFMVWFVFIFFRGYYQYKKRALYLVALEENGLTEEIVNDQNFVEGWTWISKEGVYRYCLVKGGVLGGAYLTVVFSCIAIGLSTWVFPSDHPIEFFEILGFSSLLGVISAITISIFLWSVNEKKYIRLTNPIH